MLNTYEKFSMLNNDLIKYLNELITNNLKDLKDGDIAVNLERILHDIEVLKFESDKISISNMDSDKVNNLRYSIMNSLFLISDLLHFYKLNEIERFKMRAVNYINHSSKPQIFI